MPQFDATTFAGQLFWLVVTFGALYFAMAKLALPRIGAVLEARAARIAEDLAQAGRLKEQAQGLIDAYEKALGEARGRASAVRRETEDAAAKRAAAEQSTQAADLQGRIRAAEQSIARARAEAMGRIEIVAGEIAIDATRRLTGAAVGADEARAAVAAARA